MTSSDEICEVVFKRYDTTEGGSLDLYEMKKALRELAEETEMPEPSDTEIEAIYKSFDHDKDGEITLAEFKKLFTILEDMRDD